MKLKLKLKFLFLFVFLVQLNIYGQIGFEDHIIIEGGESADGAISIYSTDIDQITFARRFDTGD